MPYVNTTTLRLNFAAPVAVALSLLIGGCVVNTQTAATQAVAAQTAPGTARPAGAPAPGAPQGPQVRGARAGIEQKVDSYSSVNPDCSSAGVATAELLTAPVHGSVTFEALPEYTNFPQTNQRFECNKQKSPALVTFYKSAPDYKGRDEFAVKILFPDGMTGVRRYVMTVD